MATNYFPELYDFLREIGAHQDREWFKANKDRYDHFRALWVADIDRLLALCRRWWPELAGQTGAGSIYRIYRDTRFSHNKDPYKTYFAAAVCPHGRNPRAVHMPGFYIQAGFGGYGVSSEELSNEIYGGVWAPEAPVLKKLRRAIVDTIEEFEEIISDPKMLANFPQWIGERLKTVPKGYDRDHPQAELLRLKDFGRDMTLPPDFFCDPDWPEAAAERMQTLYPLLRFLDYSINEE